MIALNYTGCVGLKTARLLEDTLGDLDGLIGASPHKLRKLGLDERQAIEICKSYGIRSYEKESELASKHGVRIITLADEDYPACLLDLQSPPLVLYVSGELRIEKAVGIVGTRVPTPYGARVSAHFSRSFAKNGVAIVSGLAVGIDSMAHQAALGAGGLTVAVLGSGLLNVYPNENKPVAERICRQGAVVSEYPLMSAASPQRFPMRNRIIAALSQCVLVVEAGLTSGAIITCDWASEIGRQVYCIPGDIGRPQSLGCNMLIRDGAGPALSPEQILSDIWGIVPEVSDIERLILSYLDAARTAHELEHLSNIKERVLKQVIEGLVKRGLARRDAHSKFIRSALP